MRVSPRSNASSMRIRSSRSMRSVLRRRERRSTGMLAASTTRFSMPAAVSRRCNQRAIDGIWTRWLFRVKPKFNAHITSARLCGSCHTIDLPVVDKTPIGHSVEQNTYLEWVNSQYQNEFGPVLPSAKTCQDCHMPGGYTNAADNISVPQIQTRIASVEDDSYPAAEHSAPLDKIRVRAISVFGNRNRGSRIRTLGPAVRRAAGRRHRSPPPEQFVGDSPLEEDGFEPSVPLL